MVVVEVEADVDDDGVGGALVVSDMVELACCVTSDPSELVFGVDAVISVGGDMPDDDELVCDVDIVVVVVDDASVVAVVAAAVVVAAVDVGAVCDDDVVVVVGAPCVVCLTTVD